MHFLRKVRSLIEPKSTDYDLRRREFILNVLLMGLIVLSLAAFLIVIVRFVALGSNYTGEPLWLAVLQVVFFLGLWILSRKGYFVPAAYVFIGLLFALAFYSLFTWGILLTQGMLLLALVLAMASILLGTSAGLVITILASVILISLGWLQQTGKVGFDTSWMQTPGVLTDAIVFSVTLGIITTVSWLSNREIARFNDTLQDRVRSATARLRSANKNLKTLDKAKDDFISMASHQLGTPLTAITGYLSMVLDNDKRNMTIEQREFITFALEAAEKMVGMSSDMLNVSRLNSGRFLIQRQSVDMAKMVEQEVHQLIPAAKRKKLKLTMDLPKEPVMANIDESKTRQVIMNFIDNAIYYTQSGGVHVTLKAGKGNVELRVVDTGIGVPPAEQAKLFSKFYRAENAKVVRPDGTGLGLYLAKRVIEDQNGHIIFETTSDKGSTFGFTLPA
jgi:signal transduction histidine kinase